MNPNIVKFKDAKVGNTYYGFNKQIYYKLTDSKAYNVVALRTQMLPSDTMLFPAVNNRIAFFRDIPVGKNFIHGLHTYTKLSNDGLSAIKDTQAEVVVSLNALCFTSIERQS